jgi:deoxycytidine triphosphate deaminase
MGYSMTALYAQTIEEAQKKYADYCTSDPFPGISPALLNSADIADYVRRTGMLFPFVESTDKLKPASYEVDFVGEAYFWEKNRGKPEYWVIGEPDGLDSLTLPPNSIYFFSPRTFFQIPNYIALRFNLRIQHVHRGLLLGTGPLVDPGFCGRLLIPLHNLTSEPYTIEAQEGLIWVDFTKVSPFPNAEQREHSESRLRRLGPIAEFPKDKRNIAPIKYLKKAAGNVGIQSSILEVRNRVDKFDRQISLYKRFAWFGILIAVVTIVYPIVSVVQDANKYVRESEKEVLVHEKAIDDKIKIVEERILKLEKINKDRIDLSPRRSKDKKTAIENK